MKNIRNNFHYISIDWYRRAEEALGEIQKVTKAFNGGATLVECTRLIYEVHSIGVSEITQKYLYMATMQKRRDNYSTALFRAYEEQKDFIKKLVKNNVRL